MAGTAWGNNGNDEFAGGDGSEAAPFLIETWHHLNNTRDYRDKHFELIADLDEETDGYSEHVVADPDEPNGEGWEPIPGFTGAFDGKGRTISGLFIDRSNDDDVGLFGTVNNGTVKNVGLVEVDITGNARVGGLAGKIYQGNIKNSYATGTVKGDFSVGGLVGYHEWESVIENSYTAVNVTGTSNVGGLVGSADSRTVIENSYSTGKVTGGSSAGGLKGAGSGMVLNSHAAGRVEGKDYIGGLVGSSSADIIDSYAAGAVTGTGSRVGGLAGEAWSGDITNSHATGAVDGDSFVGGLVGQGWGNIRNSYATGFVTGTGEEFDGIGGLAGALMPGAVEVVNSYAAGDVYAPGAEAVGGLAGLSSFGATNIKNSYSTGNVHGGEKVGGLVGSALSGVIKHSYSTGKVTGQNYAGGFVGDIYSDDVTLEDSFWDVDEDGLNTGSGEDNSGAIGKTTEEMKEIATFTEAGWDIQTSGTDLNDGYPYLAWQLGNSPAWYIYEADDPDPRPRPGPDPEPEPDYPLPPEGFNCLPGAGFPPSVKLTWLPGAGPDTAKYNIYASTGSGASSADVNMSETESLKFYLLAEVSRDVLEYTHSGLSRDVRYYYVVTSVNEEGLESNASSKILWCVAGTGESGELDAVSWGAERIIEEPEDDDSSGCLIATAAYGSAFTSEVTALRGFRDGFLLGNSAGAAFTRAYYRISPAFSELIEENSILRSIARMHLAPVVKAVNLVMKMN